MACWAGLLGKAGAQWHEPLAMALRGRRRPDNLLMQSGMDLFYGYSANDISLRPCPQSGPSMWRTRAGPLKMALPLCAGPV